MHTSTKYTDRAIILRVLQTARPYWLHIFGLFVLNLLSSGLSLLTPLPLKIAVDSVVGTHPLPGFLQNVLPSVVHDSREAILVVAILLLVMIALLNQVQELAKTVLRTFTSEKLLLDFRSRLFGHVQRLSLGYHDTVGISDTTYRIQWDAPALQYITIDGIIPLVSSAFTLVSMMYISIQIDWQLALVALGISPILVLLSQFYRRRLRGRSKQLKELESSVLSVMQETLGSLRVVKAFGQEEREHSRFVRHSQASIAARVRLTLFEGSYGLFIGLTTACGTALVLYIGIGHVLAGTLTLGNLLLLMAYIAQLYLPLKTFSRKAASMQSYLASAERAFSLLDQDPDVPEHPHARSLVHAEGAVSFEHVCFSYSPERRILNDVSFTVDAGTRVGIIGTTGAGKTTLMSLLTRFYDPTSGRILLDGSDLRDYKVADLRNQFSIVLQEPLLFSTSIAENIGYARPEAGMEEIIQAATAANAHDFIARLPHGYDTLVGERGMRLSGGERQRIALARAFLKNAPILILDEPTSSVDTTTEAIIMEAMERLMHGRTTFMIAHRLSTLSNCHLLLVLEHGELRRVSSDVDAVIEEMASRMPIGRVGSTLNA